MYLLFGGNKYYPQGGVYDIHGHSESIDELKELTKHGYHGITKYTIGQGCALSMFSEAFEWWHIVDTETMEMVCESEERAYRQPCNEYD